MSFVDVRKRVIAAASAVVIILFVERLREVLSASLAAMFAKHGVLTNPPSTTKRLSPFSSGMSFMTVIFPMI